MKDFITGENVVRTRGRLMLVIDYGKRMLKVRRRIEEVCTVEFLGFKRRD